MKVARLTNIAAGVAMAGTVTLVPIGTASASTASALPPNLAKFAHCPISDSAVTICVAGSMTGSFTVGSNTLTTPKPAKLSLGLVPGPTSLIPVAPTDGTSALQSPPIPVSILGLPGLPGPLAVTAVPKLVGVPSFNIVNLLNQTGTASALSLYVKLNNIALGSSCTIGTKTDTINLNMTTGTTSPPPPNQPITGARGTYTTLKNGEIVGSGVKLVDNSFSVPGANGCGLLGILDLPLDLIEGLPSPAGKNSAVFSGNTYIIAASIIRGYLG